MFVVLTDPDPDTSVEQIYFPDKYLMIDAAIECLNYACDIFHPERLDPVTRINYVLWGKNLPTLALYAIMLAEALPDRPSMRSKIRHLSSVMRATAGELGDEAPAWPAWITDERYVKAGRGVVMHGGDYWYKQFDWYEETPLTTVPYPDNELDE